MSKSKEAGATKAILEYLNRTNRPYSAGDIFNNLHKEFGKTAVTRALDDLAANGKIKEKVNGKQKIYFANQDQFPSASENQLKSMDAEIIELTTNLKGLNDNIKEKEARLSHFNSSLSIDQIEQEISKYDKEVKDLKAKIQSINASVKDIDPKENEKIKEERNKVVREWRKRKRMANSILEAILEGYPKPKKTLMDDIGIETDEDYKVTMPSS